MGGRVFQIRPTSCHAVHLSDHPSVRHHVEVKWCYVGLVQLFPPLLLLRARLALSNIPNREHKGVSHNLRDISERRDKSSSAVTSRILIAFSGPINQFFKAHSVSRTAPPNPSSQLWSESVDFVFGCYSRWFGKSNLLGSVISTSNLRAT